MNRALLLLAMLAIAAFSIATSAAAPNAANLVKYCKTGGTMSGCIDLCVKSGGAAGGGTGNRNINMGCARACSNRGCK